MNYKDYSLEDFSEMLASKNPTPGGGSAAAVGGALAASLLLMVVRVTARSPELESLEDILEAKKLKCLELIEEDADCFNRVMEAHRLPRSSEKKRRQRRREIEAALKKASNSPLEMLDLTSEIAELAVEIVEKGNPNAVADAAAAGLAAHAAAETAFYNIMTNLESIEDEKFVEKAGSRAYRLREETASLKEEVIKKTEDKISILGRDWQL
ncbi:cyclodeaminase/cyclohydrolase family protein [Halarsenatibacter silvermanii]|uniref:Formiminotransferase-cyclodeaminase n=1 Tax=Halarsenatibacter silvermanii TaxID=321763 RepID=A0A1G9MU19_9FIRM|nr:cyclodeaminase/cyclohydrolase family protein [Halarsenatibacter silvermanii]SDL77740.1 Formiminotransferase-cyclodeaminase [Halarsenatibacter silvermanii]